ncbi:MAG TPA: hypothetical protein VL295_04385 [Gemmatimonadales bacterium]|jgi:hypothetical protein|nr:hypothetical protein [Gemmatimonadales bacterium]
MASPAIPPIVYGAVWAQLLPALALLARRNRSRAVVLIASAVLLGFATDWIGRYVGHRSGNSLWFSNASGVPITVMILMGLADWQVTQVERLAFRLAVVPYGLVFAALFFWAEDMGNFSRYSYPFSTLVVLGAAIWTLLRRALLPAGIPLLRADWFLVALGLALNAATTTLASPVAAVLLANHRVDLIVQVWSVRAIFVIIALCCIAAGAFRPPSEIPAAA